MDDVARAESVCGNNYLGMESCSEKIDSDHWRSDKSELWVVWLAQHHFVPLERGVGMTADRVADDLGEEHKIR